MVYLITGKARAGKTTYGMRLSQELRDAGEKVVFIDGDEFRGKHNNFDFTNEGRRRNLLGAADLAAELEQQGQIVIMAFIAPRKDWRDEMRAKWQYSRVIYIPGGMLWEGTTYERPDELELSRTI